ncbi:hypothetical protein K469DRAFT_687204 [Zopfia rhizophila CBS 207.26]|uniref:Uncharacterized protein n=1 Tax=Zopfia rhizophila CBS 207.26 TaxID=1314779 RepID=A0A6A6E7R1_9PEZI|nr:hypothetical protein K469DRAFT_687204 [Zopfia rhizophila CBS 207.26]
MFVPNTTSRPNPDLSIPQNGQLICTMLTHIPLLFLIFKSFHNLIKGEPTGLWFTLGGLISSACEPILDVMGFCFFPRPGNWIAFEFFGRPIPYFVIPTYGWYVGGQGYLFLTIIQNKKTTRSVVLGLWLRSFIANLILEYTAMYFGMFVYYGYQPFAVRGFPLWFPAIHSTAPVLAAVVVHMLEGQLEGMRSPVIGIIVATLYPMVNAGFGWPVWCALSLDRGLHVTYPAACITAGLIATGLWIATLPFAETRAKAGGKSLNGKVA